MRPDDAPDTTRGRQETSRRRRVRPTSPQRNRFGRLRPDADPRFGKGQALTRTARSNPDLARGRDQGFGQACVPSLNSGVQCGAADLSKSAAAP